MPKLLRNACHEERKKKLLAMKIGMTVVLAASKLSRSFEDASRV
jgi:hypothetical protein